MPNEVKCAAMNLIVSRRGVYIVASLFETRIQEGERDGSKFPVNLVSPAPGRVDWVD